VIVYLDSSTVLRVLLRQKPILKEWGNWEKAYASEILGLEARRAIDRLRLEAALADETVALLQEELRLVEETLGSIPLTRAVLRRAAMPMATAVKTLDSIHLASALLYQERQGAGVVFATHDAQQAMAARALGLPCIGA
jgi:predicted nucleic acid-binding protein